jgi:hypothetical protein
MIAISYVVQQDLKIITNITSIITMAYVNYKLNKQLSFNKNKLKVSFNRYNKHILLKFDLSQLDGISTIFDEDGDDITDEIMIKIIQKEKIDLSKYKLLDIDGKLKIITEEKND